MRSGRIPPFTRLSEQPNSFRRMNLSHSNVEFGLSSLAGCDENIGEGIAICCAAGATQVAGDFTLCHCNQAFSMLFGTEQADLISVPLHSLNRFIDIDWQSLCLQALQTGAAQSERVISPHTGHSLQVQIIAVDDRSILLRLCPFSETDEKASQFTHIVRVSPLVGFCCSRVNDGKIVAYNHRFAELFGYNDSSQGPSANLRNHFIQPEKWDDVTSELLEYGSYSIHRVKTKRLDGKEIWIQWQASLNMNDNTIDNFVLDVTEEKIAFDQLRESERRFRDMLEKIQLAAIMLDTAGNITFCNDFFLSLTGWKRDDILGKSYFERFIPDESRESVASRFNDIIIHKDHTRNYRTGELLTIKGLRREIFWNQILLCETDGAIAGLACIGEDITERKHAEKALKESLNNFRSALEGTVTALSTTSAWRDPYTAEHQSRVANLACSIAREMGLPKAQIDGIHVAGLLHDIGKIAVPIEILCKPGKITRSEFEIIKTHPQVGFDISKEINFPWQIARTILQHHERFDGSGYPEGLKLEQIVLGARILGVADVVEAMASHRPYRPALGLDVAMDEITQHAGTRYDPDVVSACVRLLSQPDFSFDSLGCKNS